VGRVPAAELLDGDRIDRRERLELVATGDREGAEAAGVVLTPGAGLSGV
jgi:hypothetical protein